ncbi:PaaI family thioesterase [Sphingomonas sp. BIUV-7]|uniref:PaaI family thioesterase n=1 Tax=Sphingomonas natans TaxID=3063330 RepID=A0ABT8YEI9_9SPHN|nr:PaaI family thioesterase [Sphingomonas sp. BIUV-7]MDO6416769.1 PaaI family thioesterase [Sphingomonas sp. BIUV-7]
MSKVQLLPYADFLGIRVISEDGGSPVLAMSYSEGLIGAPGRLHGGAVAGLLEIAAIAAIDATLEEPDDPRQRFKPINVTVDYIRAGKPVETYARGVAVRVGTRIGSVHVEAWQDDPTKPIAAARMKLLIAQKGEGREEA